MVHTFAHCKMAHHLYRGAGSECRIESAISRAYALRIAAVSCVAGVYRLGGVKMGLGLMDKLGRALVGAWVVHGCMVVGGFIMPV